MLRTILHRTCSPREVAATSHIVSSELVDALCARHPGATVLTRDLASAPPAFVDAAFTREIRDPALVDAPEFEQARRVDPGPALTIFGCARKQRHSLPHASGPEGTVRSDM